MDAVQAYLKKHTDFDWEAISPLYLYYKTTYNIYGQFCVFAPGDWIRKDPYVRFYVPAHKRDLHNPQAFLKSLNNAKQGFIKIMPWVKVNLDDKFPKLQTIRPLPDLGPEMFIKCTIGFTGDLKLRMKGSISDIIIGSHFRNIAYEAKIKSGQILSNLSPHFDAFNHRFSLEMKNETPIGESSFKIADDNSVEITYIPKDNNLYITDDRWEIIGKIGYILKGKIIYKMSDPIIPILHELVQREIYGIHSIIIFVKEILEQPSPPTTPFAVPVEWPEPIIVPPI